MTIAELAVIFCSSLIAASLGYVFLNGGRPARREETTPAPAEISLLFQGTVLEHATDPGRAILTDPNATSDWEALYSALYTRFPGFPELPRSIGPTGMTIYAREAEDLARVQIMREGASVRVDLTDPNNNADLIRHQVKTLESDLAVLELATDSAPYPMWHTDECGQVDWFNDAYRSLAKTVTGKEPSPKTPLFPALTCDPKPPRKSRTSVQTQDEKTQLWYDVTTSALGIGTMFHAVDINAVIKAEIAQRNFVQTLAKTFAHLSTGLAIFDRNGQLALYNPSLADLTSLPAEFLSGRPDVATFFDRLREARVMPEPKDYKTWRQRITTMINEAADGVYEETWTLESGQTFRVNGRPHPDGAIAFLIEDISAEVSLTRSFRSEIELGQALIDTIEDSMVVFSSNGIHTISNLAYTETWKLDPDNSFADITIIDSVRAWQDLSEPSPVWGEIRDFVTRLGERSRWQGEVRLKTGEPIIVDVCPIASGATAVRFVQDLTQSIKDEPVPGPRQVEL